MVNGEVSADATILSEIDDVASAMYRAYQIQTPSFKLSNLIISYSNQQAVIKVEVDDKTDLNQDPNMLGFDMEKTSQQILKSLQATTDKLSQASKNGLSEVQTKVDSANIKVNATCNKLKSFGAGVEIMTSTTKSVIYDPVDPKGLRVSVDDLDEILIMNNAAYTGFHFTGKIQTNFLQTDKDIKHEFQIFTDGEIPKFAAELTHHEFELLSLHKSRISGKFTRGSKSDISELKGNLKIYNDL